MGLKSTCHLCDSVYEAVEMATPVFFGEHPVMRSEFGYFLPTTGFVCQSCVDSNGIDIERTVRDYHRKPLDEQRSDEEHVQAYYKTLLDEGLLDWQDWESSSNGLGDRSKLTVGAEVMVRYGGGNFKVEGIILPPSVNYTKNKIVQSWFKSGITKHVVLLLEGGRFVRGNRAHIFCRIRAP